MSDTFFSKDSGLVIVDIQEKLLPAMPADALAMCLKATHTLVELAKDLGAPILYTEQYPQGLGRTEPGLLEALEGAGAQLLEKREFSVCGAPGFQEQLRAMPKRLVVVGMETHVCVLSTVRDLLFHGREVIVPFDAVTSRRQEYRDNGLAQMRDLGAAITNHESIVFEALVTSEHEAFRKFSKLIR